MALGFILASEELFSRNLMTSYLQKIEIFIINSLYSSWYQNRNHQYTRKYL